MVILKTLSRNDVSPRVLKMIVFNTLTLQLFVLFMLYIGLSSLSVLLLLLFFVSRDCDHHVIITGASKRAFMAQITADDNSLKKIENLIDPNGIGMGFK